MNGVKTIKCLISVYLIFSLIIFSFITILIFKGKINEGGVQAQTIIVDDNGQGDYKKIQNAIDNASSGDMIFVYSGTYNGNLKINKTISLIGESNRTTIITGAGGEDLISINANWVNISCFKILQPTTPRSTGILLNNVSNCTISKSNISNQYYGIYLVSSELNIIKNNSILTNVEGIHLDPSSNSNLIEHNDIFSNKLEAIYMNSVSSNVITNNSISGLSKGGSIHIVDSSLNSISKNTISTGGISLYSSCSNTILNNTFTDGGILIGGRSILDFNQTIDIKNTVNGKPIYYFRDQSWLNIDGRSVGQILLVNCTNSVINNMNVSHTTTGVELAYSTKTNITNSTFSNNLYGIYLKYSRSNTIANNSIHLNNIGGIDLSSSSSNMIADNSISNNGEGICLGSSRSNIITNNSLKNNDVGINFWSSKANIILNNAICLNNKYGIELRSSSNINTIQNNSMNNNQFGIFMADSSSNIIMNNFIENNEFGVYLRHPSPDNKINFNYISNNTAHGIYVWDIRSQVNATYNWWGDAAGPYNLELNPGGVGDNITDYIDFKPWLTAPHYIIKPLDDTDSDGIINLLDEDDDNDGWNDTIEQLAGSDLLDYSSIPLDTDDDSILDYIDMDDDNDDYDDTIELSDGTDPLDNTSTPLDYDNDFIPDSMDDNIDGDDVPNDEDDYPYDETRWKKEKDKKEKDVSVEILAIVIIIIVILLLGVIFYIKRR